MKKKIIRRTSKEKYYITKNVGSGFIPFYDPNELESYSFFVVNFKRLARVLEEKNKTKNKD